MYLPKSQYKKISQSELPGEVESLVNELGELFQKNKSVVLTAFGTIFDTAGINFEKGDFSKAKQLFKQESEEDFDRDTDANPTLSSDNSIVALKLPPTSKDRKKGVMKRCFLRNKCTGDLREISKVQLTKLYRNTDKCIELATMDWIVKGTPQDQIINGYFLEGIERKNANALAELNKIMPGVNALIKSPLEYLEIVDIPKSKSIKPQSNDIVIPSPGKSISTGKSNIEGYSYGNTPEKVKEGLLAEPGQFLIEGTTKTYIGLYHIHPTKGPMAGAKHVKAKHSKLIPINKSDSIQDAPTIKRGASSEGTISQGGSLRRAQTGGSSNSPSSTGGSSSGGSLSGGSSSGGSSSGGGYGGY